MINLDDAFIRGFSKTASSRLRKFIADKVSKTVMGDAKALSPRQLSSIPRTETLKKYPELAKEYKKAIKGSRVKYKTGKPKKDLQLPARLRYFKQRGLWKPPFEPKGNFLEGLKNKKKPLEGGLFTSVFQKTSEVLSEKQKEYIKKVVIPAGLLFGAHGVIFHRGQPRGKAFLESASRGALTSSIIGMGAKLKKKLED